MYLRSKHLSRQMYLRSKHWLCQCTQMSTYSVYISYINFLNSKHFILLVLCPYCLVTG